MKSPQQYSTHVPSQQYSTRVPCHYNNIARVFLITRYSNEYHIPTRYTLIRKNSGTEVLEQLDIL